jgi:peptidoglycan/LPS O-acetylase OafA/YrhL
MLKAKYEYFKNLDGLRFLCFLSVYTVHTLHVEDPIIQNNLFYKLIVKGIFANGGLGVNFFFVLSGFLITYLLILEKQSTGTINVLHFWFKRIIRIWPLYFVCVLFGFGVFPIIKHLFGETVNESADLKLYLFFLGNFDILKNGWPDSTELGVLWSISIEEQFYLVWPVFLYFLPIKKYWILFFAVIICSLFFRAVNDDQMQHYYHTLSCISDMAMGGLGAWLIHIAYVRDLIVKLKKREIILIYIIFFVLYVFKGQLLTSFYIMRIFERLLISVFIILIILEQNYSMNSFYKMGNYKSISKFGLTTYGMYMLHIIGFLVITTILKVLNLNHNYFFLTFIGPLAGLSLSVWLSQISYHVFEKRFLALKKYLRN